jgi:hypothetical protein
MEKHIETILDYNPTEQEWKRFGFKGESHFMKYYHDYIKSNDSINYQLGLLFAMRGEKDKANKYWQKVENDEMLKTLWEDF